MVTVDIITKDRGRPKWTLAKVESRPKGSRSFGYHRKDALDRA